MLCEKPFSRRPADVEEAFDAAERSGRLLSEAFMYRHNPQTARLVELVARWRDRRAAGRPLRLQLLALRRGEHPPAHRRRGRQPHGRRLLLRERLAAPRGRARDRLRSGVHRAERNRLGFRRSRCAFPETSSRSSTAGRASPSATSSRRSAREGSLFLDDPWHCQQPVIELRRDGGVERIELDAARLVPPRAREPERRDPRRGAAPARPR